LEVYYATFGDGVFKSIDGGSDWVAINDGLPTMLLERTVATDSAVFVVSPPSGVYRSRDGLSWEDVTPPAARNYYDLTVHPADDRRLFVETSDGVYRSDDEGDSWIRASDGLPLAGLNNLIADPSSDFGAYIASYKRLFRTINGRSWHEIGPIPVTSFVKPWSLLSVRGTIFAGQNADFDPEHPGLLGSRDGGRSWFAAGLEGENVPRLQSNAFATFAFTDGGLYLSRAGRGPWFRSDRGINAATVGALLPLEHSFPGILASVNRCQRARVARSFGAGSSWLVEGILGPYEISSLAATHSKFPVLLAGSGDAIFRSEDLGDSWSQVPLGGGLSGGSVRSIAPHPNYPLVVFAATDGRGLIKSVDAGVSWATLFSEGHFDELGSVLVSPDEPGRVLIGSSSHGGIGLSRDGGITFEVVAGTEGLSISAMAMDPTDSRNILAATWGSSALYRSLDGGLTWNAAGEGSSAIRSVAFHPLQPQTALAGAEDGIYLSNDGGETWRRSDDHLSGKPVTAVSFGTDGTAYAGTRWSGVFVASARRCGGLEDITLSRAPAVRKASFKTCNSITAGVEFLLEKDRSVALRAPLIRLIDGFVVESGAEFTAGFEF